MKVTILYCRTCSPMEAIAAGPGLVVAGAEHESGDPPTAHTDIGALVVQDILTDDLSYYDSNYSGQYE